MKLGGGKLEAEDAGSGGVGPVVAVAKNFCVENIHLIKTQVVCAWSRAVRKEDEFQWSDSIFLRVRVHPDSRHPSALIKMHQAPKNSSMSFYKLKAKIGFK